MALRTFTATAVAATALAGSLIGTAASATTARADFAAQAQQAGLTGSQARELQSRVDGYLATTGGRQTAANKIETGAGTLVLTLPGEEKARDLDAKAGAAARLGACPYENFCMYRGTYYTGDQLNLYHCRDHALSNWRGWGSWVNNQTPGTQARLLDRNHGVVTTTAGAYSWEANYYWEPIWYVRPC
ncbi:hypothetical protein AB0K89_17895 [Streptomyces cinnamoneus]|uniref:hypothetical protein n=1 Tax=Streptomyces cinnamoneus TaxID=53446 RepID=UPI0034156E0E